MQCRCDLRHDFVDPIHGCDDLFRLLSGEYGRDRGRGGDRGGNRAGRDRR
jgi:hypothetical protein